jgi:hypothetical protein
MVISEEVAETLCISIDEEDALLSLSRRCFLRHETADRGFLIAVPKWVKYGRRFSVERIKPDPVGAVFNAIRNRYTLPGPDAKQEAIFTALDVLPPRHRVQEPARM